MNKFDFAQSVIKASPWARLTDRAFLPPLLACCAVWIAAINSKTSFDRAIDFTQWLLGTFIVAEKGKDALTAFGALKASSTPDTVNVGTLEAQTPYQASQDFNITDFNMEAPTSDPVNEDEIETFEVQPIESGVTR